MVNKRLKRKTYTSPAVEVMWIDNEAQLMWTSNLTGDGDDQEGQVEGGTPGTGFGDTAKRFDFANIYDIDGISDGLELEFDIHYSTGF